MSQQNQLPIAVLDNAGLALNAGWLTIHRIEPTHREYQQTLQEYIPEGVGLPALCYLDEPPAPETDSVVVRNSVGTAWEVVQDYRGKIAYSTDTRQPEAVNNLGPLDVGLTLLAPSTPYDSWNGKKWVTDTAAQHDADVATAQSELVQRQRVATDMIAMLQDASDLGMATDDEAVAMLAWKKYRVLLSRVDVSTAPHIEWPTQPGQ